MSKLVVSWCGVTEDTRHFWKKTKNKTLPNTHQIYAAIEHRSCVQILAPFVITNTIPHSYTPSLIHYPYPSSSLSSLWILWHRRQMCPACSVSSKFLNMFLRVTSGRLIPMKYSLYSLREHAEMVLESFLSPRLTFHFTRCTSCYLSSLRTTKKPSVYCNCIRRKSICSFFRHPDSLGEQALMSVYCIFACVRLYFVYI